MSAWGGVPARGAVFDLDGVLVDTARLHFQAWRATANHLGFDLDRSHEQALRGISRIEALQLVLQAGGLHEQVSQSDRQRLAATKNELYLQSVLDLDASGLLPGAAELLDDLELMEVPFALASASRNARTVLRRLGIESRFAAIVDGTAVDQPKPDPEVFKRAVDGLALAAEECVVFEDAPAGISGALRAGCPVVGVGDPAALSGATFVVASLTEIRASELFIGAAQTDARSHGWERSGEERHEA